jgi:cysteinyl-tRNA synthetase
VDAAGDAPAMAPVAAAAADVLLTHAEVLGLDLRGKPEAAVPAEVQALFDDRQAARKARDFANADRLRDELLAQGWVIEDRADGSRLVPST